MFEYLPVEVQVYILGIFLGLSIPLVLYWFLYQPLKQFLREIFASPPVEQFWLRVVLIGFVAGTMSVALVFRPVAAATVDETALFFNVADNCKQMLDSLAMSMLVIFLPLLAAYTILHLPRRRVPPPSDGETPSNKETPSSAETAGNEETPSCPRS